MERLDVVRVQMVTETAISYDAERLTTPEQAASAFCALVGHPDREIFCILMLDGKNRIASIHKVSEGSLNQSIVHPREVFKAAILANAASILLLHNHPTGDTTPSRDDLEITRRLKESGVMLGIQVMDHIVVDTETGRHLSFAAQGMI